MYRLLQRVSKDDRKIGLTLPKAMFRISGVFIWEKSSLTTLLYPLAPLVFINLVAILNTLQVFKFRIRTLDDFTDMFLTLIVALVFSASGFKLVLFHLYKARVKALVDFLESLPKLEGHGGVQKMERVCIWYLYLLMFSAIPKYFLGVIKGELPFLSAWPFDTNTSAGWWTAYTIDTIAGTYCCFTQSCFDSLLAMSVTLMTGHLRRLGRILSNIGRAPDDDYRIVKEAVQLHVKLLKGVDLINYSYRVLIMFQCLYAIVHAVVILFYLVKVSDIRNAVALSFLLMAAYSQLFLYCSSGQLLTSEMEKVHTAIFNNFWYRSRPQVRKAMVIMGMRSLKPVTLNNYGIFNALHITFLRSCQESFSYYIVLRTIEANIKLF